MRRPLPLGLYLVTDRAMCAARGGVEAVVAAAVRGGVTIVQLRDDDTLGDELAALAQRLKALLAPLAVPLVVNNRLDVALASGADAAHVGQGDMSADEARARLGPDAILGLSITDPAQLAAAVPAGVDYLGVGPVFATGTKPDAATPMGLAGLAACRAATTLPIVAIGGLDATNTVAVMRAGADGIAVVSAVCAAPDPEAAARRLAGLVRPRGEESA